MIKLKNYSLFDSLIAGVEETENPSVYRNADRRFSTLSNGEKTSDIIALTKSNQLLFKYKKLNYGGEIEITHLADQAKSEELGFEFEITGSEVLTIKGEAPVRYCITSNSDEPQYCYGEQQKQAILASFTRSDEAQARVI